MDTVQCLNVTCLHVNPGYRRTFWGKCERCNSNLPGVSTMALPVAFGILAVMFVALITPLFTFGILGWAIAVPGVYLLWQNRPAVRQWNAVEPLLEGELRARLVSIAALYISSWLTALFTGLPKESAMAVSFVTGAFWRPGETEHAAGNALAALVGIGAWLAAATYGKNRFLNPAYLDGLSRAKQERAAKKLDEERAELVPYDWETKLDPFPQVERLPQVDGHFNQEHIDHYAASSLQFWKTTHAGTSRSDLKDISFLHGKSLKEMVRIANDDAGFRPILEFLNLVCLTKGEFYVASGGAALATNRRFLAQGPNGLVIIPFFALQRYSLKGGETLAYTDRHGKEHSHSWTGTLLKESHVERCELISDAGSLDENMKRLLWMPRAEIEALGLRVEKIVPPDRNATLAPESRESPGVPAASSLA